MTNEVIYKSRNTILKQLEKRGYNINDYNGFSINEIYIMSKNKQMDMLLTSDDGTKKVYVKYYLESKSIRNNNINDIALDLFDIEQILTPNDDIIIIINSDPNETCINHLIYLWETEKKFISVINISRLQFDITEHDLVPEHVILNEEETNQMIEQYFISNIETNLPQISRFDPVALAIGIRPGQTCKIFRPSKTAIVAPFYRYCLNK